MGFFDRIDNSMIFNAFASHPQTAEFGKGVRTRIRGHRILPVETKGKARGKKCGKKFPEAGTFLQIIVQRCTLKEGKATYY